jgi:hypothetical protein
VAGSHFRVTSVKRSFRFVRVVACTRLPKSVTKPGDRRLKTVGFRIQRWALCDPVSGEAASGKENEEIRSKLRKRSFTRESAVVRIPADRRTICIEGDEEKRSGRAALQRKSPASQLASQQQQRGFVKRAEEPRSNEAKQLLFTRTIMCVGAATTSFGCCDRSLCVA